jgi:heme oxygenase
LFTEANYILPMDDLKSDPVLKSKAESFQRSIKEETAELHAMLEALPLLTAIISPGVTAHKYCCYLALMKKIAEAYETQMLPLLPGIISGPAPAASSQQIEMDLLHIDHALAHEIAIRDFEIPFHKLQVPFALGFMYVMEGSKLGGRVIFTHIHRSLGYTESSGAGYLAGYGADTSGHWKKFLLSLSRYAVENDCEEEVIEGAQFAFSSIHRYFVSNRFVYEN